jgi:polar amino acid transport system substrate-binding protein
MARSYDMDRRAYLATVGATGASVAVTGCIGGGGGGGSQEITAGTAPGFPPFEIKEGGELKGFDIDLLEAVVDETDYTLAEWKEFEFKSLIPALTSDKIDVIAAAMTINDERDQKIDFTDPYYSSDQSIIVAEGGDFSPSSLDDLSGQNVGAQKGTTGESIVQEQLIKADKRSESSYNAYDSYVLAVQDLENGNIDAIVIDQPVGKTFAKNRDVTVAFTVSTGEQFGFGVRTDADDLTEALNGGISAVRESGTYDEVTAEWFG